MSESIGGMANLVGATVAKKFDVAPGRGKGKRVHTLWLEGEVVHFDPFDQEHWVEYKDGDHTTLAKENLHQTHSEWTLVRAAPLLDMEFMVVWAGGAHFIECSRCMLETAIGARCSCCRMLATGRAKRARGV